MPTFTNKESLYYNDVNLLGKPGTKLKSRSEVPIEKYRIIASPMEAITSEPFVIEAAKNGISIFLHRFHKDNYNYQLNLYKLFQKHKISDNQICCVSVGLNKFKEDVNFFYVRNNIQEIGIDCANGYLNFQEYGDYLRNILEKPLKNFYVGNVNTADGYDRLCESFIRVSENRLIRIGIGGGSPCSSSDVAGINRGNITEIVQCDSVKIYHRNSYLTADGGISKPGFASKAFAAGADYIMLGGYFSQALEAETNLSGDGSYWGGASEKQLERIGQSHKISEGKVIEDRNKELKPLKKLIDELWGGLASAVTYSGVNSLNELIGNGLFEVKKNSLPPKNRK